MFKETSFQWRKNYMKEGVPERFRTETMNRKIIGNRIKWLNDKLYGAHAYNKQYFYWLAMRDQAIEDLRTKKERVM